ncbi:hypothetical protein PVAP13_6NG209515 [Panicum virgatum]|uniref:Uncharacterized protein n=1 Tax=Panicum virgatum TaxID=38727 RepID=A0A8T0R0D9_PANVG|nr:hypothetical protein PVAP13_6NG209515 [Panicum virgatum]
MIRESYIEIGAQGNSQRLAGVAARRPRVMLPPFGWGLLQRGRRRHAEGCGQRRSGLEAPQPWGQAKVRPAAKWSASCGLGGGPTPGRSGEGGPAARYGCTAGKSTRLFLRGGFSSFAARQAVRRGATSRPDGRLGGVRWPNGRRRG